MFLMTNMSLLDEFIGRINPVIMNLQHDGSGGDLMIETVILLFFNFFYCMLELEGNELVKLIGSVQFQRSNNLDIEKRFQDEH